MGSDPKFLLSNIEMGRVHWRRGSTANELFVEVGGDEPPQLDELGFNIEMNNSTPVTEGSFAGEKRIILPRSVMQTTVTTSESRSEQRGSLRTSRLGVYNPRPELGYGSYD